MAGRRGQPPDRKFVPAGHWQRKRRLTIRDLDNLIRTHQHTLPRSGASDDSF